jgi:hypothetical protein
MLGGARSSGVPVPTPYTQNPIPYTLHPKSYTLTPKSVVPRLPEACLGLRWATNNGKTLHPEPQTLKPNAGTMMENLVIANAEPQTQTVIQASTIPNPQP